MLGVILDAIIFYQFQTFVFNINFVSSHVFISCLEFCFKVNFFGHSIFDIFIQQSTTFTFYHISLLPSKIMRNFRISILNGFYFVVEQ